MWLLLAYMQILLLCFAYQFCERMYTGRPCPSSGICFGLLKQKNSIVQETIRPQAFEDSDCLGMETILDFKGILNKTQKAKYYTTYKIYIHSLQ